MAIPRLKEVNILAIAVSAAPARMECVHLLTLSAEVQHSQKPCFAGGFGAFSSAAPHARFLLHPLTDGETSGGGGIFWPSEGKPTM